ncbi:unnamed protein product, partial [Didymodactylos carnosus]
VHTNDPTAHAEIVAIRSACSELKTYHLDGCVIYCSCEPSPMCLGYVECGFDDRFIYEELARELHERKVRVTQLLKTEGKKPFTMWVSSAIKTHY